MAVEIEQPLHESSSALPLSLWTQTVIVSASALRGHKIDGDLLRRHLGDTIIIPSVARQASVVVAQASRRLPRHETHAK